MTRPTWLSDRRCDKDVIKSPPLRVSIIEEAPLSAFKSGKRSFFFPCGEKMREVSRDAIPQLRSHRHCLVYDKLEILFSFIL